LYITQTAGIIRGIGNSANAPEAWSAHVTQRSDYARLARTRARRSVTLVADRPNRMAVARLGTAVARRALRMRDTVVAAAVRTSRAARGRNTIVCNAHHVVVAVGILLALEWPDRQ
jgi:hypothetical protein